MLVVGAVVTVPGIQNGTKERADIETWWDRCFHACASRRVSERRHGSEGGNSLPGPPRQEDGAAFTTYFAVGDDASTGCLPLPENTPV